MPHLIIPHKTNICHLSQLSLHTTNKTINSHSQQWMKENSSFLTLSAGGSSSVAACTEYATKLTIAAVHSSSAKPLNMCFVSRTHSGVRRGGLNSFGPSLSSVYLALSWLIPYTDTQPK